MNKVYKYQADFDAIAESCTCPGSEYFSFKEKEAFRFVFEDPNHPNNFVPPLKISPKRFLTKEAIEKCESLGLSLYGQKSGAINKFEELIVNFKNFKKVIGTHIAMGIVDENDGHITKEDEFTHFDMYEFAGSDLSRKFVIVDEL